MRSRQYLLLLNTKWNYWDITNGGTTWVDTGVTLASGGYAWCLANFGGGIVCCGTRGTEEYPGGIWRSTDYGVNWTNLGSQFGAWIVYAMISLGNGIGLAGLQQGAGTDHIIRTTDYGATWTDLGIVYEYDEVSAGQVQCFADFGSGIVVAGTYPGGFLFRSTNYGLTWSVWGRLNWPTVNRIEAMIGLGGGKGLLATITTDNLNTDIYKTADYGVTWTYVTTWTNYNWTLHFCDLGNGIVLTGANRTVDIGGAASMMRSTNDGDTWTNLGEVAPTEECFFGFAHLGSGAVVSGTDIHGHIIRSTDYGLTWTDLGQQGGQWTSAILDIVHLGNNICIACTENSVLNGRILRSTY